MAITCPVDLDKRKLRAEIQSMYARVADDPQRFAGIEGAHDDGDATGVQHQRGRTLQQQQRAHDAEVAAQRPRRARGRSTTVWHAQVGAALGSAAAGGAASTALLPIAGETAGPRRTASPISPSNLIG